MLFKKLLFVGYPNFGDEGFQRSYYSATDYAAGLRVLIVSVWYYRGNVLTITYFACIDSYTGSRKIFMNLKTLGRNYMAALKAENTAKRDGNYLFYYGYILYSAKFHPNTLVQRLLIR